MRRHSAHLYFFIATSLAAALLPGGARAFEYTGDQTGQIAGDLMRTWRGRTICAPASGVRRSELVDAMHRYEGVVPEHSGALTNDDLYHALTMAWPCPFDPIALGAKPASSDQLIGFWQLAADSRSETPKVSKQDLYPVDCAGMAFAADGRLDTMVMSGSSCPALHSADFAALQTLPRSIGWAMASPNALTITRPAEPRFREVWKIYSVVDPFDHGTAQYRTGDLLMFLKRYNDYEDHDITLYFRHLQRLVD